MATVEPECKFLLPKTVFPSLPHTAGFEPDAHRFSIHHSLHKELKGHWYSSIFVTSNPINRFISQHQKTSLVHGVGFNHL